MRSPTFTQTNNTHTANPVPGPCVHAKLWNPPYFRGFLSFLAILPVRPRFGQPRPENPKNRPGKLETPRILRAIANIHPNKQYPLHKPDPGTVSTRKLEKPSYFRSFWSFWALLPVRPRFGRPRPKNPKNHPGKLETSRFLRAIANIHPNKKYPHRKSGPGTVHTRQLVNPRIFGDFGHFVQFCRSGPDLDSRDRKIRKIAQES